MAFRGFCRTVNLDVSQLAVSHDRKSVSTFIVNHFAQYNIHAVQFVGKTAKVTFAVEASRQAVIAHQAVNINGVQCAVHGGGPRSQNVLVYNYPVEGSEESLRGALGAYGVIERVSFRHWTHMEDICDGVRIVRMVRRLAIPRNVSIDGVNVKIAYAGQQQVCDLCTEPGHIARTCPMRVSALHVSLLVISLGIVLSAMVAIVTLWTPPPRRLPVSGLASRIVMLWTFPTLHLQRLLVAPLPVWMRPRPMLMMTTP